MKRIFPPLFLALILLLGGCGAKPTYAQIAATTLPVYEFTAALCEGTGLSVTRLVTESVSCLHDYSLKVDQVKAAEAAETIVMNGAELEDFLHGVIDEDLAIDASRGIALLSPEEEEEEAHGEHDHEGHHHEHDPHIWLSPILAKTMAENICDGLSGKYPEYEETFRKNLEALTQKLSELDAYGEETLKDLSCRELITFHDGFAYFADRYDLKILEAVEEESGSEASAKDLIHLITLARNHHLEAIFTEKNGSPSAASVLTAEIGAKRFALDMAMSADSYFDAMYYNINTIKEALG